MVQLFTPPLSNFRTTIFIEQMNAWYDCRTKEEVLNTSIFALVQNSIGTSGLVGLDKLLSFMLVKELQVCKVACLIMISVT